MRSRPQEPPAEDALCSSLLRVVQDDRKIAQLREEVSGLSHRCRNLLNGMKMSLYLVRREAAEPLPALWANVEQSYGGIEQILERLQMIYRPMTLTLVRAPFKSLVRDHEPEWHGLFEAPGRSLEIVRPAAEAPCAFDPMLLSGAFDAFLRWRATLVHPLQPVRLSWRTSDDQLEVSWNEFTSEASSNCQQRHEQNPPAGLSLALPLLARVIRAHHGALQLSTTPEYKLLFTCPLVQPEPVAVPAL